MHDNPEEAWALPASSMGISIRMADLEVDRPMLTGLLTRNLNPSAGGSRFDWLYLRNPHGFAKALIAIEEATGKAAGVAAAFPRKLRVDGRIHLGYVLGDFCIEPTYRSLGLALRLQRTCLERCSTSFVPCFDFPSDRMMAIYRRMKIAPIGQIVRWSKPLRAERKLRELIRSARLARQLASPVNKLLEWKDTISLSTGGWSIAEHQRDCDQEFTELTRTVGSHYGMYVERSAEYLNWRYREHPLVHHEFLTARRDRELRGYVVFSQTSQDARIVDLFGFADRGMWTALLARVVALLHARKIMTLSIPALDTNPWTELLSKWGFRPREGSPVVVCVSGNTATFNEHMPLPWFLTDGDRES